MPLEITLPSETNKELKIVLLNLAILFQDSLIVTPEAESNIKICLDTQTIILPTPDLSRWKTETPYLASWRGISLPQISPIQDKYPDLLGLLFYLYHDLEEKKQQILFPQQKFRIKQSIFAPLTQTNYVDQVISELKKDLGLQNNPPCGVILTHDLDFLSLQQNPKRVRSWQTFQYHKRNKEYLWMLANLKQVAWSYLKNPQGDEYETFEFLDWIELEKSYGFESVFFVFAPLRRMNNIADAWYNFGYKNFLPPFQELGEALHQSIDNGVNIGLHLSRSANYEWVEIQKEFKSLQDAIGIPITMVRNHWLWMEFANWYDYLSQLGVKYDFNSATIGYPKGSCYPYWNVTGQTITFPTVFMDDIILKPNNLFLSQEEALALFTEFIQDLKSVGGCFAISFHPAEDGYPSIYNNIPKKLDFYKQVLELISYYGIQVYDPEGAKNTFIDRIQPL